MFVKVNCTFCQQPFDFDSSSGLPQIDCPHCGKQNVVETPSAAPKPLTVQHDAPNLSGAKPCPSCRQQIARDARLCVHCGYNFATGQKTGDPTPPNPLWVVLGVAALIAAGLGAAYWFWPASEPPPPAAVPASESPAVVAEPTPVPPPPVAPTNASPNASTKPEKPPKPATTAKPPPPPAPSKEELAAQKAAAEQAAFEAKKAQAEQTLRLQLASREPMYKINEPLELRRHNGVIDKGTLTGFAGTGTGRVALVATPRGEIGVPLNLLDNPTRRRMDPEYREAFIQHLLSTKLPDSPGEKPAGSSANEL